MNELIETIFADFVVDNKMIPVSFLRYSGKDETYITYECISSSGSFSGDDVIIGYVDYYDFDVYSKSNYFKIVKELKNKLQEKGFMWQPNMSSEDMFEDDTGYYHKTLCFAIERMEE